MKRLTDISWNVTEAVYRKDKSISYSMLSTYERDGFDAIFKHKQTSSLTFGSIVDTIMTDGWEAFLNQYIVLPLKSSDTIQNILIHVAKQTQYTTTKLSTVDKNIIIECAYNCNYCKGYKDDTIYKKILTPTTIEDFTIIVNQLQQCDTKHIITPTIYNEAKNTVDALYTSTETKWYFSKENDGIERYYQLKFKDKLNNIWYRCMADLIVVDHLKKQIIPCDLKTTGKPEPMFWSSFHKWFYFYQAKLYWNLIRQTMDKDPYFKDFELLPYKFIVVNKNNLSPMVYSFDQIELQDYVYDSITYRNPLVVGEELQELLNRKNQQMNQELITNAIDKACQGLKELKEALFAPDTQETVNTPLNIDLLNLAKAIASTYSTTKPNIGADNMYKNIMEMICGEKHKIIIKWVSTSHYGVVDTWKKLPVQDQTMYLKEAAQKHKDLIIEILQKRYE